MNPGISEVTRHIDHLGVRRQVLADLRDRVALDQDVAARDVTELRIHGEDVSPAEQVQPAIAPPRVLGSFRCVRPSPAVQPPRRARPTGSPVFERIRGRQRDVRGGDPNDGSVQVEEALLRRDRRELRSPSAQARVLLHGHEPSRPAHRAEDGRGVERNERADVDHLRRDAVGREAGPPPPGPSGPWRPARRSVACSPLRSTFAEPSRSTTSPSGTSPFEA